MAKRRRTLVIGDSLAVGTAPVLKRRLPGRVDVNAKIGRRSRQGVRAVRRTLNKRDYDRIVFDVGTNDPRPRMLRRSLKRVQHVAGDTPVYVPALHGGPNVRRKNRIIRGSGVKVLQWKAPLAGDHLHPTTKGYRRRGRQFTRQLQGRPAFGAHKDGGAADQAGSKGGGKKGYWKQPIVPGSTVTRRQLRRETRAAATEKYGALAGQQRRELGEARAYKRDIGDYYTNYLEQVRNQSQNVQDIGQQAQTAISGLQAGVTGLAAADLRGVAIPAQQDAAARGAQSGDLATMASNAAATRQALVGSFGAQQAATNAAEQFYASNRARAVAPAQRLSAIAQAQGRARQAREKLEDTARERGAFRYTYGQTRRGEESKNVLARQALQLEGIKTAADIRADRASANANRPANQAREEWQKNMARNAAKYGYGLKKWKALGPAGRRKVIRSFDSKPADSPMPGGAFSAYTKAEYMAMSPAQRQRILAAYNRKHPGSGSSGGSSGRPLTTLQTGDALNQVGQLGRLAEKARTGQPWDPKHKRPITPLDRAGAAAKLRDKASKGLQHPILITAALDAAYAGQIRRSTIRQLRRFGYNPRDVARQLGVPLHSGFRQHGGTRAYGGGGTH